MRLCLFVGVRDVVARTEAGEGRYRRVVVRVHHIVARAAVDLVVRSIEGWPFVYVVVAIVAGDDVATQATANVFVARSSGDGVVAALAMDAIVALTAG